MDEVVFILVLMFLGVIFDLIKKAQKKGAPPPVSEEEQLEAEARMQDLGKDIQDLIAEELGLNLERRPRIQTPPGEEAGPRSTEGTQEEQRRHRVAPARPTKTPEVRYPKPAELKRGELAKRGRELPGDRRRAAVQKRREPTPTAPLAELSLEERAIAERGEPVSLETERRPEDHEGFHRRYAVPKPVDSHREFHDRYVSTPAASREQPRSVLPDRKNWSAAQKAIVWAEILGPPKGLADE